jgi:tRNA (mo5U34)-methyltransferase
MGTVNLCNGDVMDYLATTIDRFPQWGYPFVFPRGLKISVPPHIENRTAQRERYFFDPLVELCGGDLKGRRVLDLACNAGWWSLSAIRAGAEYVYGVDGRTMHVEQANIVFSEFDVERHRYRFETRNVFEVDDLGQFDVVLCLGLLYHVAKPFELLELISGWNTDLLVLDTAVNRYPGSLIELHHENTVDLANAVDHQLVVSPSKRAIVEMGNELGYRVVPLMPRFTNWLGCGDFRNGTRRAFICAKSTPLTNLDVEPDRPISDTIAWVARVLGRTFIKRGRRSGRRAVGPD